MPWTWIRPADSSLLLGRPLLDLGTGDGQTVAALAPSGLVVGMDRFVTVLRAARRIVPRLVAAEAYALPFRDGTLATVLAADIFHHLDDEALAHVAIEARRTLIAGGQLVAWWWETPGTSAPDAPRFPRALPQVTALLADAGLDSEPIALVSEISAGPRTVGVVAMR